MRRTHQKARQKVESVWLPLAMLDTKPYVSKDGVPNPPAILILYLD